MLKHLLTIYNMWNRYKQSNKLVSQNSNFIIKDIVSSWTTLDFRHVEKNSRVYTHFIIKLYCISNSKKVQNDNHNGLHRWFLHINQKIQNSCIMYTKLATMLLTNLNSFNGRKTWKCTRREKTKQCIQIHPSKDQYILAYKHRYSYKGPWKITPKYQKSIRILRP